VCSAAVKSDSDIRAAGITISRGPPGFESDRTENRQSRVGREAAQVVDSRESEVLRQVADLESFELDCDTSNKATSAVSLPGCGGNEGVQSRQAIETTTEAILKVKYFSDCLLALIHPRQANFTLGLDEAELCRLDATRELKRGSSCCWQVGLSVRSRHAPAGCRRCPRRVPSKT